jgi:hypothetical protein
MVYAFFKYSFIPLACWFLGDYNRFYMDCLFDPELRKCDLIKT